MPVRSLSSAVFKWPPRDQVLKAGRRWAARLCRDDPTVERVLCIGSCARGDWGVGSDLDAIVIVRATTLSPLERSTRYQTTDLPVPVDLWVYTRAEWANLPSQHPHFWKRLQREMLDLAGTEGPD